MAGHLVQSYRYNALQWQNGIIVWFTFVQSIHTEGPTLPLNCFGLCPRVSNNTECLFHHKHSEAKLSKAEWWKNAMSYVNIVLDVAYHLFGTKPVWSNVGLVLFENSSWKFYINGLAFSSKIKHYKISARRRPSCLGLYLLTVTLVFLFKYYSGVSRYVQSFQSSCNLPKQINCQLLLTAYTNYNWLPVR